MRTKAPIREKDLKTFTVEDYPYMVTKPDQKAVGGPWYYRSHKAALDAIVKDLDALSELYGRLNHTDSLARLAQLRDDVGELPLSGGHISAVIDTFTLVKYQATLVKREGF